MKLTIHTACANGGVATVAGNIVSDGVKEFSFDFQPDENYYLFVAQGEGEYKGLSTAEATLEHLRDSFTMGDIRDDIGDELIDQLRYLDKEFAAHHKADEPSLCHTSVCGIVGNNDSLLSTNLGNGEAYLFRDDQLYTITEKRDNLGNGTNTINVWELVEGLLDGDIVAICSPEIVEALDKDDIEHVLFYSKYPAQHILDSARDVNPDVVAAIIVFAIGDAAFDTPLIDEEDILDDRGEYDAWA